MANSGNWYLHRQTSMPDPLFRNQTWLLVPSGSGDEPEFSGTSKSRGSWLSGKLESKTRLVGGDGPKRG
jgi:hypothetical protein